MVLQWPAVSALACCDVPRIAFAAGSCGLLTALRPQHVRTPPLMTHRMSSAALRLTDTQSGRLQASLIKEAARSDATADTPIGTLSCELGHALSFDGLDFAEWLTVRDVQHGTVQHHDQRAASISLVSKGDMRRRAAAHHLDSVDRLHVQCVRPAVIVYVSGPSVCVFGSVYTLADLQGCPSVRVFGSVYTAADLQGCRWFGFGCCAALTPCRLLAYMLYMWATAVPSCSMCRVTSYTASLQNLRAPSPCNCKLSGICKPAGSHALGLFFDFFMCSLALASSDPLCLRRSASFGLPAISAGFTLADTAVMASSSRWLDRFNFFGCIGSTVLASCRNTADFDDFWFLFWVASCGRPTAATALATPLTSELEFCFFFFPFFSGRGGSAASLATGCGASTLRFSFCFLTPAGCELPSSPCRANPAQRSKSLQRVKPSNDTFVFRRFME